MRVVPVAAAVCAVALCVSAPAWAEERPKKTKEQRIEECELRKPTAITTDVFNLDKNWTVGVSATAQLIRYNLSSKKASVNTPGLGAGVNFRYYPEGWMAPDGPKDIRRIKAECRATTFDAPTLDDDTEKGKLAFPLLSISPTLFVSKTEDSPDISLQPALVLGLFRDLVSVGIGFNLTKPNRGDTFLLIGLGIGFKF